MRPEVCYHTRPRAPTHSRPVPLTKSGGTGRFVCG
nr:MAG TPA: hypothetical protein [Caudoviricetes sp.]